MAINAVTISVRLFLLTLACALVVFTLGQPAGAQRSGRDIKVEVEIPQTESDLPPLGNFYALVIGNDNYQFLPRLRTATFDAKAVAAMLTERYGFATTLLLDADRHRTLKALNEYRRKLETTDNLLIYYAGHGYRDAAVDKAYWLPVDARRDENPNWISADDVTTAIKGMPARHVLIISDSCYSGMMYRDSKSDVSLPAERRKYLRRVVTAKSRHLLSSGTNEPVADGGGGGHSVFARALLRGLEQMEKDIFTAENLFVDFIQESVAGNSEQLPQYSPLLNSGHDGGVFVFARRTSPLVVLAATSSVLPDSVMPGDTFTQRINVRNQGSAAANSTRTDFTFHPDFELVSADPSPINYDRPSRTAIWSLGDLAPRGGREITITLRAVTDALAATNRVIGRGAMITPSLNVPLQFEGPPVSVGRVPRARVDAVASGLTAVPGDTLYIPFFVRNPGNYPESYELRVTAPDAPQAIIYADTNGDGQRQESEAAVTQTPEIEPQGQFPVILRMQVPRSAPDRQQFAYNLTTRAVSAPRPVAGSASSVVTVSTPRVRLRTELTSKAPKPGEMIFYRLVLSNDGSSLAKNLVVTEQLPGVLNFIRSEPSLGTQDAPNGAKNITWRIAEMKPGETAELRLTVQPNTRTLGDVRTTHALTYLDGNGNAYTQNATASSIVLLNVPVPDEDVPNEAEQKAFNKGRDLFAKRQFEQAATLFGDFTKQNPNSFIIDLMLLWEGRSYIEMGRLEDAEQVMQRLRGISDTPFSDTLEQELASARAEQKSSVRSEGPSMAEQGAFAKGHRLYLDGRFNLAATEFDGFLKSHPNSDLTELVLTWLGRAHLAQGRLQDAEQIARRLQTFKGSHFFKMFSAELTAARSNPTPKGAVRAHRRQVAGIESPPTTRGSRITIISDSSLSDYSAYRSGDQFFVVLPNAEAAPVPLVVVGFTEMQIQRRGDGLVFIFRLRPNVKPRVEQRFNRLDVVFDLVGQ